MEKVYLQEWKRDGDRVRLSVENKVKEVPTPKPEPTPAPKPTPKPLQTDDTTHLGVWAGLMIVTVIGMLGLGIFSSGKNI